MRKIQDKIDYNEQKISSQTKRLNRHYVDWDEKDEESKTALGRNQETVDSNDTDSDSNDIEKNYNRGYQLLRDSSPPRNQARGAPGLNIPKYQKAIGRGHQALDNDDDTVTETSSDSPRSQKNHQQMNPIYSTKRDKQELSEGEINLDFKSKVEDDDSGKYLSNYENDEFEDADLDDDFNLPADHQQNNESYGQVQTSIKDQIHKNQQKLYLNNGS